MLAHRARWLKLLLVIGVLAGGSSSTAEVPVFDSNLISEFSVANARQGVAVDDRHFYAVTNYAISKHDKKTGGIVASWEGGGEGDPLTHMDSLAALDGNLYASHSNYPEWPMTSSIEVWDADTLTHIDTHSFGVPNL